MLSLCSSTSSCLAFISGLPHHSTSPVLCWRWFDMTGLLKARPVDPMHILPAAQYPLRGLQSLILSTIAVIALGDFTYPKVSLYTQLFYCTGHTRYSRWLYNQPWVKMNIDYLDKNINFVPYYKWTRHKICHHTKAVFALWCSPEGSCHMKCIKYRIHNTFLEASDRKHRTQDLKCLILMSRLCHICNRKAT